MPQFRITAPDGSQYNVTGPDGSTPEQALAQVQAQHSAPKGVPINDPSAGGGTLQFGPIDTGIKTPEVVDRTLAGAGKYFSDLGMGVKELYARASDAVDPNSPNLSSTVTGQPVSRLDQIRQQIANTRQLDKPLMATTAGKVGNIAAGVISTAPALMIPGANTVAGGAVIGATQGLLQPSETTQEGLTNVGIGGALGGAGQAVGNAVTAGAQRILAARGAAAVTQQSVHAERDAVLQAGRAQGYVVPPTEVNPGAAATALESISGKAATKQAAQAVNQKVTNKLVAQDLGLPADQPITQQALGQVRAQAGQVYNQVKQAGQITADSAYKADLAAVTNASKGVQAGFPGAATPAGDKIDDLLKALDQPSFSSAQAIEYTKRLRQQASANFTVAGRSGDPEARALASAQIKGADALEDMIGRHLQANGQPDLLQAFQDARTAIAKSYQAQAALKGGNVNAQKLAAQLQKGKPMSDGFGLVARFADHFANATKLPQGGVGVSKLAATVGGGTALFALGHGNLPLAAGAVASSAIPYGVRSGLLSAAGQRALATPHYAPGALGTLALQGAKQSSRIALPSSLLADRLIESSQ